MHINDDDTEDVEPTPEEFAKDDFADDPYVQAMRAGKAEDQETINAIVDIVTKELSLGYNDQWDDIQACTLYQSLGKQARPFNCFSSRTFPLKVFWVDVFWERSTRHSKYVGIDHILFGLINLQKEYPHTYIYKETLREKLVDLFVKADVDLKEYPAFSSRFHMVTKDKQKLESLFMNKPLDDLVAFPEMQLEINKNYCAFKISGDAVNEDGAEEFAKLAKKLLQILH